jgi:ACS family tartrate transporter-like MFS transporter
MPFLFFLYIIAYIDRINVGFAGLQMTSELHFTDSVFGLGSGIFFAGYAIFGIPGAVLVEKWSARKAIATTMVVWGIVAVASGFIQTASQFYSMRLILGITEAGFFPGVLAYLSRWYRARDRAKAVAMFMTAIPVSQFLAAPLSALLIHVTWFGLSGWRWLLILEGVPAVLAGIVSLYYLCDHPTLASWLRPEQRDWLTAEIAREQAAKPAQAKLNIAAALRNRDILILCAAYFGGTMGTYGLSLWMPKMIQRLGHLSSVETSLLSAIPALIGVPAMLISGYLSDRSGERRWHCAIPRFTAGLAFVVLALVPMGVPASLVLLGIATAGLLAGHPPLWAIPSTFLGAAAAAGGIGLINASGNLGGFAGPYMLGWFSQHTGAFLGGMLGMAAGAFSSAGFVLLVRKTRTQPN